MHSTSMESCISLCVIFFQAVSAVKIGWTGIPANIYLRAGPYSLDQISIAGGTVLKSHFYKDIDYLTTVRFYLDQGSVS